MQRKKMDINKSNINGKDKNINRLFTEDPGTRKKDFTKPLNQWFDSKFSFLFSSIKSNNNTVLFHLKQPWVKSQSVSKS